MRAKIIASVIAGLVLGGIAGVIAVNRSGPGIIAWLALPCAVVGAGDIYWRLRLYPDRTNPEA